MANDIAEQNTLATSIDEHLDRLLAFEPGTLPVVSLYLNTQAGDNGRADFSQFVRKETNAKLKTWSAGSPERKSFEADVERINSFLEDELKPSANGVAIFACSGAELFEAVQ